jgi:hypothetical protein
MQAMRRVWLWFGLPLIAPMFILCACAAPSRPSTTVRTALASALASRSTTVTSTMVGDCAAPALGVVVDAQGWVVDVEAAAPPHGRASGVGTCWNGSAPPQRSRHWPGQTECCK